MSSSDEHLPPDIKQLIEVIMRSLEKRKCRPILLLTSDDYERLLKSRVGNSSSLHYLGDQ